MNMTYPLLFIMLLQIFIIIACLYVQYVTIVKHTIVDAEEAEEPEGSCMCGGHHDTIEEPFTGSVSVLTPENDKDTVNILLPFADGVHQYDIDARVDYGPEIVGNVYGNASIRSAGDLSNYAIKPIIFGNTKTMGSIAARKESDTSKMKDFSIKDRKSNRDTTQTTIPIQFPTQ